MNFRELFSKLDGIAEGGVTLPNADGTTPPGAFTAQDQMALNQRIQAQMDMAAKNKNQPDTPPGAQPSLEPKTEKPLTPQDLKALQFPNQKPDPAPAVVTDPKSDVNAMARALQAVAGANKQPTMQPTTSAGIEQQQANTNTPKEIDTPKPGEPMESVLSELTQAEYDRQKAEYDNKSRVGRWFSDDPTDTWNAQKAAEKSAKDKAVADWLAVVGSDVSKLNAIKNTELRNSVWGKMSKDQQAKFNEFNEKAKASAQEERKKKEEAEKAAADEKERKEREEKDKKNSTDPNAKKNDGKTGKERESDPNAKKNDGKDGKEGEKVPAKPRKWEDHVTAGLGMGSKDKPNEQVRKMQQDLKDAGYGDLLGDTGVDGVFRANTQAALAKFQADNKLKDQSGRAAGKETNPILSKIAADKRAAAPADAAAAPADAAAAPTDAAASPAAAALASDGKGLKTRPVTNFGGGDVATNDAVKNFREIEKRARDQEQIEKDRAADNALLARYKDHDIKNLRQTTGNMQKSHFDLKQGDRDIDPKTGNVMRWRAAPNGQHPIHGQWEIDDTVPGQGFRERPGLGLIGPSTDSPEGKAIYDRQRSQIISPDDYAKLQKLRPATPVASPTVTSAAPATQADAQARNAATVASDKTVSDADRQAGGTSDAAARALAAQSTREQLNLREMSEQLHSLADELINETK